MDSTKRARQDSGWTLSSITLPSLSRAETLYTTRTKEAPSTASTRSAASEASAAHAPNHHNRDGKDCLDVEVEGDTVTNKGPSADCHSDITTALHHGYLQHQRQHQHQHQYQQANHACDAFRHVVAVGARELAASPLPETSHSNNLDTEDASVSSLSIASVSAATFSLDDAAAPHLHASCLIASSPNTSMKRTRHSENLNSLSRIVDPTSPVTTQVNSPVTVHSSLDQRAVHDLHLSNDGGEKRQDDVAGSCQQADMEQWRRIRPQDRKQEDLLLDGQGQLPPGPRLPLHLQDVPHRKRVATTYADFSKGPFYFPLLVDGELNQMLSIVTYAARMQELNHVLDTQSSFADPMPVYRLTAISTFTAWTILFLVATAVRLTVLLPATLPFTFPDAAGLLLALAGLAACAYAVRWTHTRASCGYVDALRNLLMKYTLIDAHHALVWRLHTTYPAPAARAVGPAGKREVGGSRAPWLAVRPVLPLVWVTVHREAYSLVVRDGGFVMRPPAPVRLSVETRREDVEEGLPEGWEVDEMFVRHWVENLDIDAREGRPQSIAYSSFYEGEFEGIVSSRS
ncbi:hypothetical protein BC830DRAFT_158130 [Chytriomyces sp. MP71]|nr:hypothetical protein BC830DRAFT_158130 [Chytriomyces sp. MP71]